MDVEEGLTLQEEVREGFEKILLILRAQQEQLDRLYDRLGLREGVS